MRKVKKERKTMEEALRESEKRYRGLFEGSGDAIYITTREGKIVDANPSFLNLFGYTKKEIMDLDVRKIYVSAGDRSKFQQEIEGKGFVKDRALRLRRRDGQEIDCLVTATVLRDNNGKVVGYEGIIRDITENKKIEETLKKSEAKFQELFDHAPVGYFEYDLQGRIVNVNCTELEMLGYDREEMIGQPVWRFIVEEAEARAQILAKLAGTRPPARGIERTYRRKDRTTLPVLIEDRLLLDEGGRIAGIRSIIQDVTKRKKLEEERERLIGELREALKKVKTLSGLLPICASCKKIRDDKGYWKQIEGYIEEHSEAEFSHGICPECLRKLYPQLVEDEDKTI